MGYQNPNWPSGTVFSKETWHFHKNLWERYGIRLLPGEYTHITTAIVTGKLQPIPFRGYNGLKVYKYIHEVGTPNQKRVYIVADPKDGRLVSVMKSAWLQFKKRPRWRKR